VLLLKDTRTVAPASLLPGRKRQLIIGESSLRPFFCSFCNWWFRNAVSYAPYLSWNVCHSYLRHRSTIALGDEPQILRNAVTCLPLFMWLHLHRLYKRRVRPSLFPRERGWRYSRTRLLGSIYLPEPFSTVLVRLHVTIFCRFLIARPRISPKGQFLEFFNSSGDLIARVFHGFSSIVAVASRFLI